VVSLSFSPALKNINFRNKNTNADTAHNHQYVNRKTKG